MNAKLAACTDSFIDLKKESNGRYKKDILYPYLSLPFRVTEKNQKNVVSLLFSYNFDYPWTRICI